VLVAGAVYGVTLAGPGDQWTVAVPPGSPEPGPSEPSAPSAPRTTPPPYQDLDGSAIEPGTYRMYVGADADGGKIEADLTLTGPSWTARDLPMVAEDRSWASVGVYRPDALAGAAPCSAGWQGREADRTPPSLVRQLVRLPWSTLVQPPTPTEAFGHDAIHLRLRIDDQCPPGEYYQVATAPAGSRGITYSHPSEEVLIDFWVVDLDGTVVVVDLGHVVDASTELVGRATQARDSIEFVIGDQG
jgi:hypothetical protein